MSAGNWLNNDGLYIKYGTSEAASLSQGGFVCNYGTHLTYVLNLNLVDLTETESIQNDVLMIPKLSLIESVELVALTAAVTGVAIDVGLIAHDRTTTTDLNGTITDADPDGLLAAYPVAEMNVTGEYARLWASTAIPAAATGTGALIGKILTVPTLITASRTTATAFTAGRIQIKVNVIPEAVIGFGAVH